MRIPGVVEPGVRIQPHGLHHQGVVIFPAARGIAVVAGVGAAAVSGVLRQLAAVHQNLAPDPLILAQHDDAVGHGGKGDAARFKQHVARKPKGIAGAKVGIVGARDLVRGLWLMRVEQLLSQFGERRLLARRATDGASPYARQLVSGRGTSRTEVQLVVHGIGITGAAPLRCGNRAKDQRCRHTRHESDQPGPHRHNLLE